jgi:hypothetical protein
VFDITDCTKFKQIMTASVTCEVNASTVASCCFGILLKSSEVWFGFWLRIRTDNTWGFYKVWITLLVERVNRKPVESFDRDKRFIHINRYRFIVNS